MSNRIFVLLLNPSCREPAWYQQIDSLPELEHHNNSYVPQYWNTFWAEPHTASALEKGDAVAVTRHPMNILPKRSAAMAVQLCKVGTVYLNRRGGWCTPTQGQKILETRTQEAWPAESEESERLTYITIHRWPLGNHYYLQAWPTPLEFSEAKFNTLGEAMTEAKKHAPEARISFADKAPEKFIYPREGD